MWLGNNIGADDGNRKNMIWLYVIGSLWLHDFHFSRLEMNYNDDEQIIECTISVFIDDLELALQELNPQKYYLGTEKEIAESDKFIAEYLEQSILLSGDNGVKSLNYIGKETSDDLMAFYIHFFVPWEKSESLSIEIDLLSEIYGDQKNLVEFESGDINFHYLFDIDKTQKRIQ